MGVALLLIIFVALLAFIAIAPKHVIQIALTGVWLLMAIGVVVSISIAILR